MAQVPLPPEFKERTTIDLLKRAVKSYPEKTALVGPSHLPDVVSLTYRELDDASRRIAGGFRELGLRKGDCVGILVTPGATLEAHLTYHAAHKLGGIVVPINARYVARELEYIINFAGCRLLLFEDVFADTVAELRPRLKATEHYIVAGRARGSQTPFVSLWEHRPAADLPRVTESDCSTWLFTSGTTGNPKCVVHTHGSSVATGVQIAMGWGMRADDVYESSTPFYTSTGAQSNILSTIAAGCTHIVDPDFDLNRMLARLTSNRATLTFWPTSIVKLVLDNVDLTRRDLSPLRRLYYAGQRMSREFHIKVDNAFHLGHNIELVSMLAQTESGPSGVVSDPQDHRRKPGTLGNHGFGPWTEYRIVDEHDENVQPGVAGELLWRGPSVMKEYLNDTEATAEVFRGGWLHSGDLVVADEEGYLFFVDRKKETIRRGGFNIAPAEVEMVVAAHPAVLEVAVVAAPHAVLGEQVRAVVVLKPDAQATAGDIIGFCKGQLADYKVPRIVDIVDSLPRNAMGRVLKGVLRGEPSAVRV